MKFDYRESYGATSAALIIGLPENFRQMDDFEEVDTLLNGLTEKIVEQKVLSTEAGKITATGMMIGTEYRKVIALGLGKADSLDRSEERRVGDGACGRAGKL